MSANGKKKRKERIAVALAWQKDRKKPEKREGKGEERIQ